MAGSLKETIFSRAPYWVQNMFVTGYNLVNFKERHGPAYHEHLTWFQEKERLPKDLLEGEQTRMLREFLTFAKEKSPYYSQVLADIDVSTVTPDTLSIIPLTSKEELRINAEQIFTDGSEGATISRTGGTTGKPLAVRIIAEDSQIRHAMLDVFRGRFGYKFGEKCAWFSGKTIVFPKDISKNRYWKYDPIHKIRYYSTFHINARSVPAIIKDFNRFKPKYIVGFPSSLVEIAKIAMSQNLSLDHSVIAIFPTAETIVPDEKELLESFFGGDVYNQYASSEGAPFITECEKRNLHIEPLTGVFEVLDDDGMPARSGSIAVTAFHTRGTPLIRYLIGDRITLKDGVCDCGRNSQLVESIEGRINDYVYSAQTGKINLGNISNCLKYVTGVNKFQIIQNEPDAIIVKVVKDAHYSDKDETMFRKELVDRLGPAMDIRFDYVDSIAREFSGKYRLIKNNIKP